MYKKILVPIDGSDASELGLNEAIKLAGQTKAAIRLLHVVDELIITSATGFGSGYVNLIESLRQQGQNILDKRHKWLLRGKHKDNPRTVDGERTSLHYLRKTRAPSHPMNRRT